MILKIRHNCTKWRSVYIIAWKWYDNFVFWAVLHSPCPIFYNLRQASDINGFLNTFLFPVLNCIWRKPNEWNPMKSLLSNSDCNHTNSPCSQSKLGFLFQMNGHHFHHLSLLSIIQGVPEKMSIFKKLIQHINGPIFWDTWYIVITLITLILSTCSVLIKWHRTDSKINN